MTTAMEDTGALPSLSFLDQAGRVDRDRVLILRTASNYAMQHAGITAVESLSGEKKGDYSAFLPSLEAAWRVGHPVVEELVAGWPEYAETLPEPGQSRVSR